MLTSRCQVILLGFAGRMEIIRMVKLNARTAKNVTASGFTVGAPSLYTSTEWSSRLRPSGTPAAFRSEDHQDGETERQNSEECNSERVHCRCSISLHLDGMVEQAEAKRHTGGLQEIGRASCRERV